MALGIGYTINQAKSQFFDQQKVLRPKDRAVRRVLSRFGAFVRTTARRSIRRRKRSSEPGQPPRSHTGLLRRLIFFAYEPTSENVVIGPADLSSKRGDAPHALEEGGRSQIGPQQTAYIEPRPYMGPAFKTEREKNMPDMWRDSIR